MSDFPRVPIKENDMNRRNRMNRLGEKLRGDGLYVEPVPFDDSCTGWGYFIVAVDNPYEAIKHQGQDQG